MSLRERGLEPVESVRGTRETTAAAEGVGDIRVHPRCCPLAHASPTLTFSLLGDSHLNVPQEQPCGDELEGTGAAGAVAGGERRPPDAGGGLQRTLSSALCWAVSFALFKHQISAFCRRRHPEPVTACGRKGNHMKADSLCPGWAGLPCLFVLCVVFF